MVRTSGCPTRTPCLAGNSRIAVLRRVYTPESNPWAVMPISGWRAVQGGDSAAPVRGTRFFVVLNRKAADYQKQACAPCLGQFGKTRTSLRRRCNAFKCHHRRVASVARPRQGAQRRTPSSLAWCGPGKASSAASIWAEVIAVIRPGICRGPPGYPGAGGDSRNTALALEPNLGDRRLRTPP